jgi:hypothetical protein
VDIFAFFFRLPSSLKQVRIAAVMVTDWTSPLVKVQPLFGCVTFFKRFLSNLSSLLGCSA